MQGGKGKGGVRMGGGRDEGTGVGRGGRKGYDGQRKIEKNIYKSVRCLCFCDKI